MLSLGGLLASILSNSLSVDASLNLLLIAEETEVKLCSLLKYLGISCAKSKQGQRMSSVRNFISRI
jgi:hypothetical protein